MLIKKTMKKISKSFIVIGLMICLQGCIPVELMQVSPPSVDGIYYSFYGKEAIVVPNTATNSYSGHVVIPSTVTYKGKTYNVTKIKSKAFNCSRGLLSVTISEGVTSIGKEAFWYCDDLHSVTIPESMKSIGTGAFAACYRLDSVTIPEGVSDIKSRVFNNSGLQSVIIPEGVKSIGRVAFASCGLSSITIPESVKTIGEKAFYYNSKLESVTIKGATTIGDFAFSRCGNLNSVTISESVTRIGNGAFADCVYLRKITNLNPVPVAIHPDVFSGVFKPICALYVPAESVDLYKKAAVWKEFKIMALKE